MSILVSIAGNSGGPFQSTSQQLEEILSTLQIQLIIHWAIFP
jgi:hypothetical protein